jgi:hypothetical protein
MATLDELRRRLESLYLEPVVEESPTVPLTQDLNASAEVFRIEPNVLSPDEESHIGPGRLLEIGYELVRVLDYDSTVKEVSCRRGVRGTNPAAHTADGDEVRFPTRWPRHTIAEALRSAIHALWQPLFVAEEVNATTTTAGYVDLPLDTVRVLQVQVSHDGMWTPADNVLFHTHPTDQTRAAVQLEPRWGARALCLIRYGRRVTPPDDISEEIELLPAKWERIVLVDAAAELISGVDVDAVTQEVLTQQIRLEQFPVRSGSSISQNLIRYREYLVEQAASELVASYPRDIHMNTVVYER